jgi:CheY-like chemotaxis protein
LTPSSNTAEIMPVTCRILHVNDSDVDHQVLAEVLQSDRTFSLERARSGLEALQQLRHKLQLPNLVVINWSFALITCPEFLDQMKSEKRLALIPIVVIASGMTPDEVTLAYDSGAACVLRKGSNRESLARSLEALTHFRTLALLPFCDSSPKPAPRAEKTGQQMPGTRKASMLTAKERSAIGKKAVQARWARAKTTTDARSGNKA